MLNLYVKFHLRRLLGVIGFSIGVALCLSVPALAVYYNIGMFWRTQTAAIPAFTERRIAAGVSHGCAVVSDGTAKCWGNNSFGRLGDGTTTNRSTPVTVSGLSGVVSVTGGGSHSCAALSDGTAKCWGSGSNGKLGNGALTDSSTPVAVSGLSGVVSIAGGESHTCAALSDGSAKCWGDNGDGGLGDGTTTYRTTPVTVSGLSTAVAISAGSGFTCAVLSDGTAKCWGDNLFGQLGNGASPTDSSTPVTVSGISGAVSIDSGWGHSCAVLSDGTMKCWGYNGQGRLGDGTITDRTTPVTVSGLSGAVSITAGNVSSCVVVSDGTAKCWGWNSNGELGNGTTTDSWTPVAVSGLAGAISIAAGGNQVCAALSDGTVKCWGYNASGQLGNETTTNSSIPVSVTGSTTGGSDLIFKDAVSIAAGTYYGCALFTHGTAKCWGYNSGGSLGDGTTTQRYNPVTVSGLSGAVLLTAGHQHTCAILSDGTAKCWGGNSFGQLGDGTTTQRNTPVTVSGLSGVASITARADYNDTAFSCASLSDGSAKCWGRNNFGQLGNGTTTNSSTPVAVSGLSGAVSITAGGDWTVGAYGCAALSNGTAKCWGSNSYGQLGNGTTTNSSVPVTVSGLSGVVSIAAKYTHTCAGLADGTVKCWGDNVSGQLGDGTTTNRSTPVVVSGLSGAVSISAGDSHSCAILSDGTAKCWGANSYGTLGDGTTTGRLTPVTVTGLSGVISIAGGSVATCAVLSDGTGKCWGWGGGGSLGDGTPDTSFIPVSISLTAGIYSSGSATANNGGGTTSLVITKPTSTSTNRVMVAGITTRGSITITTPSGWTLLQSQMTGNISQSTYYRVATAADDSVTDYTWALSSTAKASGVIITYVNVDPISPILTSDGLAASSGTITAPDLTTSEAEFQSVAIYGVASDNLITGPSGYTFLGENASTGNAVGSRTRTYVTHKRYTTSGATGAITATVTSADNVGQHVLLKRAP